MEEDWGADANAPSFSLFDKITPQAAAEKELIDPFTYNRWSKAERKIYRKLRIERISSMLKDKQTTVDDLAQALADLNMFRDEQQEQQAHGDREMKMDLVAKEDNLDDLIGQIESMKIVASSSARTSR